MTKKILAVAVVAVCFIAFAIPASAIENEFGGYWRTRAYTQTDFSGNDDESQDVSQVDFRTRLYYTAIINDNLKFVNKFEIDATWGDNTFTHTIHNPDDGSDHDTKASGGIGADGYNFEIKNTYADFTIVPVTTKVGTQG